MRRKLKVAPFRRKREGKTDYRMRIRMLSGQKPRLVIRPAVKNMSAQIVVYNDKGDIVVAGSHSHALKHYGWTVHGGNLPAAYLTGYLLGMRARKKNIGNAVLDTGTRTPIKGGRIYACAQGVIDAGVHVPIDKKVIPSIERLSGAHIELYAKQNKKEFQDYVKKNVDPTTVRKLFAQVKAALQEA